SREERTENCEPKTANRKLRTENGEPRRASREGRAEKGEPRRASREERLAENEKRARMRARLPNSARVPRHAPRATRHASAHRRRALGNGLQMRYVSLVVLHEFGVGTTRWSRRR